ncbi:hypothetical protein [Phormidesmis priestleyi]|nr:hypothetical protein [Phormidesmis priestleyi]
MVTAFLTFLGKKLSGAIVREVRDAFCHEAIDKVNPLVLYQS